MPSHRPRAGLAGALGAGLAMLLLAIPSATGGIPTARVAAAPTPGSGWSLLWIPATEPSYGATPTAGVALPAWNGQGYGIWLAAYSGYQVRLIENYLGPYLNKGDGIAVVLQLGGFAKMNAQAASLHRAFPNVTLRAYTSLDGGTLVPGGLASTIHRFSHNFTQISGDYEVNGPLEFSPNYTAAKQYFTNFTRIVHKAGFNAIAYPSGRALLGGNYNWNYGGFAKLTDGQTIESQGYCGKPWKNATREVWKEYNGTNASLRTLSLQISLGHRCTLWQSVHDAKFWRQLTHGNVFFWWGPKNIRELQRVLKLVES